MCALRNVDNEVFSSSHFKYQDENTELDYTEVFSFATFVANENTESIFNILLHWGVLIRHEVENENTESELSRSKGAQW